MTAISPHIAGLRLRLPGVHNPLEDVMSKAAQKLSALAGLAAVLSFVINATGGGTSTKTRPQAASYGLGRRVSACRRQTTSSAVSS